MSEHKRIKQLCNLINKANEAYYNNNDEIMTNREYDELYDELKKLEQETGIIFSNSPTQKVGYEILSKLPKIRHESKMLSLDKTKDITKLKSWLGNQLGILSWKLDGLTIVLTYNDSKLIRAVTRGNGEVGELITNNAKVFKNIPLIIPYKGELILRGEAVIKYSDFNKINEKLPIEEQYKNPRNLCSGTVRQLNNEVTANRNVNFIAFQVVKADNVNFNNSKIKQLEWLTLLGFDVVEYNTITKDNIEDKVTEFEQRISSNDFASDGLVLAYDSISYSESLGSTSKFPRHSIAFKWSDELKETKLIEIQWNTSRTGLINPIAVFEPVEIEGTTVSRASVHNISIMEELQLGEGDIVKVYKANMIIPQIAENLTKSGVKHIPKHCPTCGGETEIKQLKDVKVLYCTNPNCSAKRLKAFTHFVGRDAMNIEGLSEATLEKFIDREFIKNFADIYRLNQYEEEIKAMEGLGEKSYNNLMKSIEKSKEIELPNFIYALGIQNVGLSNARLLCKHFDYQLDAIMRASIEDLIYIEGYGEIIATSIFYYFDNDNNITVIEDLLKYIKFENILDNQKQILEGKTFVITGSLEHFSNRSELKKKIELLGGKVTSSISKNTDYLINNSIESTSSKNKKAKELGIPIISENEFIEMIKA